MAEVPHRQNVARPVLAALAGLAMLLSLLSLNPLSGAASRQAGQVTLGAVTIYAALRTLNLFLSAAQEVEVGGSFVVSGSVQPLKTLEPIDDTVESVASAVLAISVVSGLLSISFGPVSAIGFALLAAGLLLTSRAPPLAGRLTGVGAMMALAVPLVFTVSGVFADLMTSRVWDQNAALIGEIAAEINASDPMKESMEPPATATAAEEEGFWSSLWRSGSENAAAVSEATSAVIDALAGYRKAGQLLVDNADELLRSYVDILAVMLFKLLLLPGLLVWVSIRVLR